MAFVLPMVNGQRDMVALAEYGAALGAEKTLRLSRGDRHQHVYCVGRTGQGKSTLLRNLFLQDVANGDGCMLVDPHGDLADDVLEHIPLERADDVVYFNPADTAYPAGFNLLRSKGEHEHHLVAAGVVSAFKHLWHDSWGHRTEHLLDNAVRAVLGHGHGTLLGVHRLLVDADFRERTVGRVGDVHVQKFWKEEFADYNDRFRVEVTAPILNKLGRLLSNAQLRNILGQVGSTIDLDAIATDGRVLIVNLSKGRIGKDASHLLGSLLVSALELAAMRRAQLREESRRDFFCYFDEFQNFGGGAFTTLLSESRKYRVGLTLGHQYVNQLPPDVRHAVLGNVGTIVSFAVGPDDAELVGSALPVPPEALIELPTFEAWVRPLVGGTTGTARRCRTLPPLEVGECAVSERLIARSRNRHARRRSVVEGRIQRWHGRV